jgi:hypothetical protein
MVNWVRINVISLVSFFVFFLVNQSVFEHFSVSENISWIFLPAGLRLFFILVYRHQALVGLFLGSLLASVHLTQETLSPFTLCLALASTLNPLIALYAVEKWSSHFSLTLQNLTLEAMMSLAIILAFFGTTLHHLIFLGFEKTLQENFLGELLTMFFGDLFGIVIMMGLLTLALKLMLKSYKPTR